MHIPTIEAVHLTVDSGTLRLHTFMLTPSSVLSDVIHAGDTERLAVVTKELSRT